VASLVHANAVADGDWLFYGRTPRGDRFSPLTQITPANVDKLQLAWQAHTGDNARPGENKAGGTGPEFNFEDTPLEVNDTLYVCTGHSWVIAYDAATGKRKWKFDPHANTKPDEYLACRGVAYYAAPAGTQTDCPRRIIAPVLDARMVALNADTGKPCEDFGTHGFISMTRYLGRVPPGFHFISSAPLVLDGRLITGGWIHDNQAEDEPSGAVRAFDLAVDAARTTEAHDADDHAGRHQRPQRPVAAAPAQLAQYPRHQQVDAEQNRQQQSRFQLPAAQPHFSQGPQQGAEQQQGVQPQGQPIAAPQQQAGGQQGDAGDQVVPGAAQHDQPDAADQEEQAEQRDHHRGRGAP
jgi:glucose dehydrogenase